MDNEPNGMTKLCAKSAAGLDRDGRKSGRRQGNTWHGDGQSGQSLWPCTAEMARNRTRGDTPKSRYAEMLSDDLARTESEHNRATRNSAQTPKWRRIQIRIITCQLYMGIYKHTCVCACADREIEGMKILDLCTVTSIVLT